MPELRHRPAPRLGLVLSGLFALALLAFAAASLRPRPLPVLSLTSGRQHSSREAFARALAERAGMRLVDTAGALESLDAVEERRVDVAIVPGALRFSRWGDVRQVTPLYVEPLHFAVKEELYPAVSKSLGALRGRNIAVGGRGYTSRWLARDVLAFAGLPPDAWRPLEMHFASQPDLEQSVAALRAAPRDTHPDALFGLGMLPPAIADALLVELRYRLVPLPFAQAFALPRFEERPDDADEVIEREFVTPAEIPAFAYRLEPPIPPAPIETLGTRLLLVAHRDVDPRAVEALLEHVFHTRLARSMQPPLTPELLALPPEIHLHAGTRLFQRRNEPLVTGESADLLANTLSIGGAALGTLLFAWQWLRQRARQRDEGQIDGYTRRVAAIERRAADLELAAELPLQPLLELQRELARIRGEVLERFLAGELGDRTLVGELLAQANACRDVLGRLILHARDDLEPAS